MSLERFQEETVHAAVTALTRASRRFLIADEVGLGKTVSARAIAAELQKTRGARLNIVYLCPNLGIAAQNLTKLQALAPGWEKPEDRLSLVLQERSRRGGSDFGIYCYTPDTSLPGWKAGQRTGRVVERSLIAALLCDLTPRLWRDLRSVERARQAAGKSGWFPADPSDPPAHLKRPFQAALRDVMKLGGKPLDDGLTDWFRQPKNDTQELILRARAALVLAVNLLRIDGHL
ncbi:DEAD/DEAH box helicase family protein [Bradyrhizobium sp. 2S1]|uniref:DEAD/DEAH box helicase family protein n=1 Tax=Bradyrhizobium sp. 2S1 TaxID=1404429 RepID=UPI00140984D1|nr:DEAD/DEAH box helicase family protein [Bradyrhizobium sp. 2S1]MCK7670066.1 DEAD/DEAH box helicase family protein [Bradyrhizobium sp. 2S1]